MAQATEPSVLKPPHAKESAREYGAKARTDVRMARKYRKTALDYESLAREYQKMAREDAIAARKYGTEDLEDEKRLGNYFDEYRREYSMGWEFMLVEDD